MHKQHFPLVLMVVEGNHCKFMRRRLPGIIYWRLKETKPINKYFSENLHDDVGQMFEFSKKLLPHIHRQSPNHPHQHP